MYKYKQIKPKHYYFYKQRKIFRHTISLIMSSLQQQIQNVELKADFILCNINSLLYEAQKLQPSSGGTFSLHLLQALYLAFVDHKQQIQIIFQKLQTNSQQVVATQCKITSIKEDFSSKLQSLQILAYQHDYQQLLKRINEYKKSQSKDSQQKQQMQESLFQESSISGLSVPSQPNKCKQFKINNVQIDEAFCYQPEEQFNLAFKNIQIRQVRSIECLLPQTLVEAINCIQDQKVQFEIKQSIWLDFIQKSQSSSEPLEHINEEQVLQEIQTFRTEALQSAKKSGIQQLLTPRLLQNIENQQFSQLQLQLQCQSPSRLYFETQIQTNQDAKMQKSTLQNKSETFIRHNHLPDLSNKKKEFKSLKKVSKSKQISKQKSRSKQKLRSKQNRQNYNQEAININLDCSNKKQKNKASSKSNFSGNYIQEKIQKKLNLEKSQKLNAKFQTDKKVPIVNINKLKYDKSTQKKTVKKTLVSFCF